MHLSHLCAYCLLTSIYPRLTQFFVPQFTKALFLHRTPYTVIEHNRSVNCAQMSLFHNMFPGSAGSKQTVPQLGNLLVCWPWLQYRYQEPLAAGPPGRAGQGWEHAAPPWCGGRRAWRRGGPATEGQRANPCSEQRRAHGI